MYIAVIVLLAIACAILLVDMISLERGLRRGNQQIQERMKGKSYTLLTVPCPNARAEELFQTINQLLELRQAEAGEYRRKEQDLRRQIADVSHDLRTPLTSILGYLQLLEDKELTPEQRAEYLEVIRGRAETLQTLITSFYDLSRIEGGQWQLEREPVDLGRELADQLAMAYEQLEGDGIRVEVSLQDNLPQVWGDRKAVVRVLSNLLTNAYKHGSDHLVVRAWEEAGKVVTSFSNGARDMTAEDAFYVFDRFYTADRTRSGQNTGLGMAIVKALVEQMGHQVSAALEDGEFTVTVVWRQV